MLVLNSFGAGLVWFWDVRARVAGSTAAWTAWQPCERVRDLYLSQDLIALIWPDQAAYYELIMISCRSGLLSVMGSSTTSYLTLGAHFTPGHLELIRSAQ